MLMILNNAYSLRLIILPRMAGGVLSFQCHLGGGLFGHISICPYRLLQRLGQGGVGERTKYQVKGKKNDFLLGE